MKRRRKTVQIRVLAEHRESLRQISDIEKTTMSKLADLAIKQLIQAYALNQSKIQESTELPTIIW